MFVYCTNSLFLVIWSLFVKYCNTPLQINKRELPSISFQKTDLNNRRWDMYTKITALRISETIFVGPKSTIEKYIYLFLFSLRIKEITSSSFFFDAIKAVAILGKVKDKRLSHTSDTLSL